MKLKPDKKQMTWGITIFLTAVASLLFYYLLFHGGNISKGIHSVSNAMMAILYGIIIAYVMSPTLNFIEKKMLIPIYGRRGITFENHANLRKRKQMRKISVFFTMAFLILILYALLAVIIPQLVKSLQEIIYNFPIYINNVNKYANKYLASNPSVAGTVDDLLDHATDRINDYIKNSVVPNMSSIIQIVSRRFVDLIKGIFNWIIGMIVAVYLLNSKEIFCGQGKKMAYAFFKEDIANEIVSAFRFVHYTFIGFITGKIVDSIIIGLMCFAGTMFLNIPYPVLISVIVGVTNIIPFFGPYIGAIVGSILLVMINPVSALVYLIFVIVLQQFDGNILGPKILGDSTGLSSFWVIFSIMLFGSMFGFVGWIVGVPVFAVFYAFVRRVTNHYLKKRGMQTDTGSYIEVAYVEEGSFKPLSDLDNTRYNAQKPESSWKKIFHIRKHG